MYYDKTNDVFYEKQPFASWTLDKITWTWKPPIEYPLLTEEQIQKNTYYYWDESVYQSDNSKGWQLK